MTDQSGFDAFVRARGPALARTAYLLTGDHHLAEDLVQAALVQAAKHWERIETSPEAYARRTMYHQTSPGGDAASSSSPRSSGTTPRCRRPTRRSG